MTGTRADPAAANSTDDVRAVERLKAEYCRLLDTKDWPGLRGLFTDDFISDTSESGGLVIQGADAFVDFIRRTLAKAVTVHQVQQPEIELVSATAATGVWAMQDVVRFMPGVTLHGFGHYHETYEKAGSRWLIKTSKLTRLREEIRTPIVTLFVSDRLRRRLQKIAVRRLAS